jgi:hypothetical protein
VAILAMIAAHPPQALGDADPASDVLLAQNTFYPYQPPVTHTLEAAMEKVLGAAARAGFPLKVAVIGSREDLGAIPNLFGHPQKYAEFLDKEISYNDKLPLLIVMPAGFGVIAAGPPSALTGIRVDTRHGSYGLIRTAILAAVALTRASGRTISRPPIPANISTGSGPPAILLFAVPGVLIILGGIILRHRENRDARGQ